MFSPPVADQFLTYVKFFCTKNGLGKGKYIQYSINMPVGKVIYMKYLIL